MPVAVPAIVLAWGISYAAATAIGNFIIFGVLGQALGFLTSQLTQGSPGQAGSFPGTKINLGNSSTSREPYHVVYGADGVRVGGNMVFAGCAGFDNKYMYTVHTLSHGECEGIKTDGDGDMIWLDDRRKSFYETYQTLDLFNYTFHNGNGTQTKDSIIGYATWLDTYRWVSYIACRFVANETAWARLPQITCVLKGRKLYDPRDGSYAVSSNGALVWLDWMTNRRYGGKIPYALIDIPSVISAANQYDSLGWAFNGQISTRKSFADNLADIEQSIRAVHYPIEGKTGLKILSYDTPVTTIPESDVDTIPNRFEIQEGGMNETPGRAVVYFQDPINNYVEKSVPLHLDGITGEEITFDNPVEFRFIGIADEQKAIDMAAYYLKRARASKTVGPIACAPKYGALDPADTIQLTHSFPGWSNQILRVVGMGRRQHGGTVPITFVEESSSLYDGSGIVIETHTQHTTTLPGPRDTLDIPTNLTATTAADTETSNQHDAYMELSVDAPAGDEDVEFRWRKQDQTKWTKIVIENPAFEIGEPTFTGTGTLRMATDGEFTGTTTVSYRVQIDGTGSPNTFKWSDDGGSTWDATGVAIVAGLISLNNGVQINFTGLTGGVSADRWDFSAAVQVTVRHRVGALPSGTVIYYGARRLGQKKRKSTWVTGSAPLTLWSPDLPSFSGFAPTVTGIKKGKALNVDWSGWSGWATDSTAAGVKEVEAYYSTVSSCTIGGDAVLYDTVPAKTRKINILGLSPGTKGSPITYYVRLRPIGWSGAGTQSSVA
jgi:hypothetical protein